MAADQVAGALDGQRSLEQLAQLGADPVFRGFLELQTEESREAARGRVNALAAGGLRQAGGAAVTRRMALPPPGSLPLVPGIRELQVVDNVVFSDLVADIRGADRPWASC